jgi:hypothetical protein
LPISRKAERVRYVITVAVMPTPCGPYRS